MNYSISLQIVNIGALKTDVGSAVILKMNILTLAGLCLCFFLIQHQIGGKKQCFLNSFFHSLSFNF